MKNQQTSQLSFHPEMPVPGMTRVGQATMQQGGFLMHTNYKTPLRALMCWLVLAIGVTGAFAASGFTRMPVPAGRDYLNYGLTNGCTMDSQGDVYYIMQKKGGFFHQKKDRSAPIPLTGLDDLLGNRMGIYVDPTDDSIWVGGVDGKVKAGQLVNGVVSSWVALPSIPLLYSRWSGDGFTMLKYTHVSDFVKDLQGRLVAATDSMAWRFENGAWTPIGNPGDYSDFHAQTQRITLYPTGELFTSFSNSDLEILRTDGTVGHPWGWGNLPVVGISMGQHSKLLRTGDGGTGVLDTSWYTMAPPFTAFVQSDSISDGGTNASYEADGGWLWLGRSSDVAILDPQNKTQYVMPLLGDLRGSSIIGDRFLLAKDSTFWFCSNYGPYQYDGKYQIPPEALASSRTAARAAIVFPRIVAKAGAVQITALGANPWQVAVRDALGRLAWHGSVQGAQAIALMPGAYTIELSQGDRVRNRSVIVTP